MKKNRLSENKILIKLPQDLKIFIGAIQAELPLLLGDTLLGIYLYGSISYNAFDVKKSDVDIIAVIRRPFTDKEFKKLQQFYKTRLDKKWLKRLEMDYTPYSTLNNFPAVLKKEFQATHFAHNKLQRKAPSDGGNPINWLNIRQLGITLFGPPPQTFVPKITGEIIFASQHRAFREMKSLYSKWMKRDIWHQTYMVVMMCRIACALREKRILSKRSAAQWGLKNLPAKFLSLMEITIRRTKNSKGKLSSKISSDLPSLMDYVESIFEDRTKVNAKFVCD
jgi:streptomycin 3"-adenylyltransferase